MIAIPMQAGVALAEISTMPRFFILFVLIAVNALRYTLAPLIAGLATLFCMDMSVLLLVMNAYFAVVESIIAKHGGITQFQGDAVLAVFTTPFEGRNPATAAPLPTGG